MPCCGNATGASWTRLSLSWRTIFAGDIHGEVVTSSPFATVTPRQEACRDFLIESSRLCSSIVIACSIANPITNYLFILVAGPQQIYSWLVGASNSGLSSVTTLDPILFLPTFHSGKRNLSPRAQVPHPHVGPEESPQKEERSRTRSKGTRRVKVDGFKHEGDKNDIVALPNEVNMVAEQSFEKPAMDRIDANARHGDAPRRRGSVNEVNMIAKQSFKRPTMNSIATTPRQSGARRRLGTIGARRGVRNSHVR